MIQRVKSYRRAPARSPDRICLEIVQGGPRHRLDLGDQERTAVHGVGGREAVGLPKGETCRAVHSAGQAVAAITERTSTVSVITATGPKSISSPLRP